MGRAGYTYNLLILERGDDAANGFYGETEMIGDVLTAHGQIEPARVDRPGALGEPEHERRQPLLCGTAAKHEAVHLHRKKMRREMREHVGPEARVALRQTIKLRARIRD